MGGTCFIRVGDVRKLGETELHSTLPKKSEEGVK
jgi:hypothetical protein